MSNEDLVVAIQNGEDRMEELWQQIERLVRWKAKRIMTTLDGRGGVEFDDLYQSDYPALVEAVKTYCMEKAEMLYEMIKRSRLQEVCEAVEGNQGGE